MKKLFIICILFLLHSNNLLCAEKKIYVNIDTIKKEYKESCLESFDTKKYKYDKILFCHSISRKKAEYIKNLYNNNYNDFINLNNAFIKNKQDLTVDEQRMLLLYNNTVEYIISNYKEPAINIKSVFKFIFYILYSFVLFPFVYLLSLLFYNDKMINAALKYKEKYSIENTSPFKRIIINYINCIYNKFTKPRKITLYKNIFIILMAHYLWFAIIYTPILIYKIYKKQCESSRFTLIIYFCIAFAPVLKIIFKYLASTM